MIRWLLRAVMEACLLPLLFATALVGRFSRKRIDVGLGPQPLINNLYHKRALERCGYTAQTYASHVFYITDRFDVRGDRGIARGRWLKLVGDLRLWRIAVTRYRCLYLYFNGGMLAQLGRAFLWRWEPRLYRLAKVRLVLMPYGTDVQEMTRSPNLHFKHAMTRDYPAHGLRRKRIGRQIDLWTREADHTISGCEWVDYMFHWDTLMLAHFSIDVNEWKPVSGRSLADDLPLRILHAPNHRAIKGSEFFIRAVHELRCAQRLRAGRAAQDALRDEAVAHGHVDELGMQQELHASAEQQFLEHDGEDLVVELAVVGLGISLFFCLMQPGGILRYSKPLCGACEYGEHCTIQRLD